MNVTDAKRLARQLMDEHGLKDIPVVFDNAKNRRGICRYNWTGIENIGLSRYFINLNDESIVRNTILHEIAHALVGPHHGHDRVWRRKAIEIGCTGERCSSGVERLPGRFKATCDCGQVYYKHRKGKNVLLNNYWICRKCNSKIQFVDTLERILV